MNIEIDKAMFKKLREQGNEYFALLKPLNKDVERCQVKVHKGTAQFERRMYVRAVFAAIEGEIFLLKQAALLYDGIFNTPFTPAEKMFLLEETFDLNDKGEPIKFKAKISLKKNIRFAFRAFAHATGTDIKLKVDDAGWLSFQEAIKIRDRLVHPKKGDELFVSDAETETIVNCWGWFISQTIIFDRVSRESLKTLQLK
jgi:hypothetical protein